MIAACSVIISACGLIPANNTTPTPVIDLEQVVDQSPVVAQEPEPEVIIIPPVVVEPPPVVVIKPKRGIEDIKLIANNSQCLKYSWKNRGRAKHSYMKGISLTFAKAICDMDKSFVKIVYSPKTTNTVKDVLAWYDPEFKALGMDNDGSDIDRLRNVYTLLIGLGMRESSGRWCCGRDMSANYSTADSAEAGIFQASYGGRRSSSEMTKLYQSYRASEVGCISSIYKYGITCSESNLQNWGTGEGLNWQKLTKDCPSFATEYAAILVRVSGGTKGEFGPLRRKESELRPECGDMLKQVQEIVEENKEICQELRTLN